MGTGAPKRSRAVRGTSTSAYASLYGPIVRSASGKSSPEPVQLYDTVADIGEKTNIASAHPEVVKRMSTQHASDGKP